VTKEQKQVCIALIGEATTQKEVAEAMKALYPKSSDKITEHFIKTNWKESAKLHKRSLRGMSYIEKRKYIQNLLIKKESKEIENIYVYISNTTAKFNGVKVPKELYNKIVGEETPGRKRLRGKRVRLLRFLNGGSSIEVELSSMLFRHNFTIWDINCQKSIEIQY